MIISSDSWAHFDTVIRARKLTTVTTGPTIGQKWLVKEALSKILIKDISTWSIVVDSSSSSFFLSKLSLEPNGVFLKYCKKRKRNAN